MTATLVWMDSFSRYTTDAEILERYDSANTNAFYHAISPTGGRNGQGALLLRQNNPNIFNFGWVGTTFAGTPSSAGQGAGYKRSNGPNDDKVFGAYDGTSEQISLYNRGDGKMEVRRSATVLGTGTEVFTSAAYRHVEWEYTIDNAAGVVKVWVDGVLDINLSAVDTQQTANAYVTVARMVGSTVAATAPDHDVYFSDYYIKEGLGQVGDLRIEPLSADGDGYQNDFTPSAGAAYSCVDETTPNGDTDYVESSTVNHLQAFTLANMASGASSIVAVAVNSYLKRTDAGAKTCRHGLRVSGANSYGSDFTPSTDYDFRQDIFTGVATAVANVNGAEAIIEVRS